MHENKVTDSAVDGVTIAPCVQCGYCCRIGPCGFGIWDEIRKQCVHLSSENKCEIYIDITARPVAEWEFSPAFGFGCSSPLFNSYRERIIANRQRTALNAGGHAVPAAK